MHILPNQKKGRSLDNANEHRASYLDVRRCYAPETSLAGIRPRRTGSQPVSARLELPNGVERQPTGWHGQGHVMAITDYI
jgi:hypothetical protein